MEQIIFLVAVWNAALTILMVCVKHLVWSSDLIAGRSTAELDDAYA